jgi:hypothetical protein
MRTVEGKSIALRQYIIVFVHTCVLFPLSNNFIWLRPKEAPEKIKKDPMNKIKASRLFPYRTDGNSLIIKKYKRNKRNTA